MFWLTQLERQVVNAPSDRFWWYSIISAFAVVACWIFAFRAIRRARLIEDVPTSKIRSAAQGYVELIGHTEVMEGPVIVAPLSGLSCVWYRYRIEERRRSGKQIRWHVIEKGVSDSLFLLRDETDCCCVIDPEGAEVKVREVRRWSGRHARPSASSAKFSRQAGWLSLFSIGRYRYTEWRLDEYDPLYVIGRFRTVGGGQSLRPLKDDVRELIAKWKQDTRVLAKFDANNDGRIDMAEWESLRKAAHQQALSDRLQEAETPAVHLVQKPDDGRPYLLSTDDPEKMVRGYRWTGRTLLVFAIVAGGILLSVIKVRVF
jgi:hypothetical protein